MPDREQTDAHIGALRLTRLDGIVCTNLRVRNPDRDTLVRMGNAFGVAFPSEPNTVNGSAPRILWLAPGEWLLVSEVAPDATSNRLANALEGTTFHFADVSHGRTVFSIAGAGARDLLARGCSLDLHPRVFAPGRCAQSLFAHIPALLHLHSGEPDFHLYIDASYEAYLQAWFARAMRDLDEAGAP